MLAINNITREIEKRQSFFNIIELRDPAEQLSCLV